MKNEARCNGRYIHKLFRKFQQSRQSDSVWKNAKNVLTLVERCDNIVEHSRETQRTEKRSEKTSKKV